MGLWAIGTRQLTWGIPLFRRSLIVSLFAAAFVVMVVMLASACNSTDSPAPNNAATNTGPGEPTKAAAAQVAEEPEPTSDPAPEPTSDTPETLETLETLETPAQPVEGSYDLPGDLQVELPLAAGEPGEIIDTEELDLADGSGYRVAYHSTSVAGDDVVVTGFVTYPGGDPPEGGWPLIAWAHGTTGMGDGCAPSHQAETDQLAAFLRGAGYAVVATDYEGLGTPGLHPYIVGASEAHGVLDSVRAVHQMGLPLTESWVVFGHSQGGHAALFTAQLQPTYAPELDLIGTIAGAPPSQLIELNNALIGGDYQGYLVMTASGLAAAYPDLDLAEVFTPEAIDLLDIIETGCTGEIFDVFNPFDYADVAKVENPLALADWSTAIQAQDPNRNPTAGPLFIIHGGADEQIPVDGSAQLFDQLCALDGQGPTKRTVYPGQSHAGVLTNFVAVPDLLSWVQDRFGGEAAPDECPAPTIDDLLARSEPLNIAHAGGDQQAPHSTLFAFGEAAAGGADVLELDVLLTADGHLVVQHDLTVERTTEGTGAVAEMTLAELDALDNAYWFSPTCWPCHDLADDDYVYRGVRTGEVPPPAGYEPDDFSIATIAEVAERFPSLPLDIEIKGEGDQATAVAEALAVELVELGRVESTIVVSFQDATIDVFSAAAPDVATSPGLDRLTKWLLGGEALEDRFRVIQIPPFVEDLPVANAENIARAHAEGLQVWVWPDDAKTQENADFYTQLVEWGADGVIAGRPSVMSEVFPDP